MRHLRIFVAVAVCGLAAVFTNGVSAQAATPKPRIGVFYYPGWKDGALGLERAKPWLPIRQFPDREPLLGWYDEGEVEVMEKQLEWMSSYGLDYVVFDWYWGGEREVLGHALRAYFKSTGKAKVPYALMWANHGAGPKSEQDFFAMVADLTAHHFSRPEYLKINGRPLVFIQVPDNLDARAQELGGNTRDLISRAQAFVKQAGYPGMLLLAGAGGGPGAVTKNAKTWGYEAYFTYNYHGGLGGRTRGEARYSRSYQELDDAYREHWDWFMAKGDLPYVIPMTAGWDKRPWGGSQDPLHDQSQPTAAQFTRHLARARELIAANPDKTLGMGILCCWNEFGEGSIVEPTKANRFSRLESVKAVFGRR